MIMGLPWLLKVSVSRVFLSKVFNSTDGKERPFEDCFGSCPSIFKNNKENNAIRTMFFMALKYWMSIINQMFEITFHENLLGGVSMEDWPVNDWTKHNLSFLCKISTKILFVLPVMSSILFTKSGLNKLFLSGSTLCQPCLKNGKFQNKNTSFLPHIRIFIFYHTSTSLGFWHIIEWIYLYN